MLAHLCLATSFVIKSATEDLYIGNTNGTYMLSMLENISQASNFYLRSKDINRPLDNYVQAGPEKYLDLTIGGRPILRKPFVLRTVEAFRIIMTEMGSLMIQRNDKCLGYERSTGILKMTDCDIKEGNVLFVFEGIGARGFTNRRMLSEISSSDDMKSKNDLNLESVRSNGLANDYLKKSRRWTRFFRD